MSMMRLVWILCLLPLLLAVEVADAQSSAKDVLTTDAGTPLSDTDEVPGLLVGQRVRDDLKDALELIRGGVGVAAQPTLEALARRLRHMDAGQDPSVSLPESYRTGSVLWVPVQADRVPVVASEDLKLQPALDDGADRDPQIRPNRDSGDDHGQLLATARRITWLPVGDTFRRVDQSLPLLVAGERGRARAIELLETALNEQRTSLVLEDRPLIVAYYRVRDALAASPRWDDDLRNGLRNAASDLAGDPDNDGLAQRIQALANDDDIAPRKLRELAQSLRKRIENNAKSSNDDTGENDQ